LSEYVGGLLIAIGCTAAAGVMSLWFAPTNIAMVYLLGVVLAGARLNRRASIAAAVLGTLAFDFFFIPPFFSFAISDTEYLVTAIGLLTVGLVTSSLSANLRRQARIATDRERRTAALYAMTRDFAVAISLTDISRCARAHIAQVFDACGTILLRDSDSTLQILGAAPAGVASVDTSVAEWVISENEIAGFGTNTLPAIDAIYLPLNATHGIVGVLIVQTENRAPLLVAEQRQFLEIFAHQIAVALEREQLRQQVQDSAFAAQDERLRSFLLSAISHDLRGPLAIMSGCVGNLLQGESQLPDGSQRQMVDLINEASTRMAHIVNNIMDMTRLEAGPVRINLEWYPFEEILGAVLLRLKQQIGNRTVSIDIPRDLPMLHVDGMLFETVLINILENAAKYTPPDARIDVAACVAKDMLQVSISDDGPGVLRGTEELIFEKFYRFRSEGAVAGTGLGLAICKAIIEAHSGRIWAKNRPDGGAVFSLRVPIGPTPSSRPESMVA
jgi:two-component system sensor histidine kinase KdpD